MYTHTHVLSTMFRTTIFRLLVLSRVVSVFLVALDNLFNILLRLGTLRYMVSDQLQPPAPFAFKCPDEWPRWKRQFEQFRQASGLVAGEDAKQVSTLLYSMGEDAEETLMSMNPSGEERASYDAVLGKFDNFFEVRKNLIFERARFNRRCQAEDESVEQFITSLYSLTDSCEFVDLKEAMIRDRIVVGICDRALSERLQMDSDLTPEKAKRLVRQREAVHGHQGILNTKSKPETVVDAVKSNPRTPNRTWRGQQARRSRSMRQPTDRCPRCGRGSHPRQECPAREAVCHSCKKRGHFQSQCFARSSKKLVADITESSADEFYDTAYLDSLTSGNDVSCWKSNVVVEGTEIPFKLDTGAEVTVVSQEVLELLGTDKIRQTSKKLCGPDRKPLPVTGEMSLTLNYKDRSTVQTIYVVKQLSQNLLGLPAIRELQLLTQVDEVETSIMEQYPALFTGLGTLQGDYKIQLKPDTQPFSLFTARNVPLPLRTKVKDELNRMETLGVIARVEEPTLWCAGMVVVPKKSGAVRICVDFRSLNESVLREAHPLPTVDETLAHLSGSTMFSKLDANSGFWQVPLAESSRHLTTFITPFGRYYFRKLPFGICSAPEHFQRRMSAMLECSLPHGRCHRIWQESTGA